MPIKGTHPIKHFSTSLEKVRAFRNRAVTIINMQKNYNRDEIYPYLIQSLHSSKTAEDFFRNHLDDEQLLSTLIDIAREDESDDARMEAAFWVSQFGAELLESFKKTLEQLSQDSWESVATHARVALNKIANMKAYVAAA